MSGKISGEFIHLVYLTTKEFQFPDPIFQIENVEGISPREWYDWDNFCIQLNKIQIVLSDLQIRDIGARIIQKSIYFYQNLGYDTPFKLLENFNTIIPTREVPRDYLPHNFKQTSDHICFEIVSGLPAPMIEGMVIRIFKSFNFRILSGKTTQISEQEEKFRVLINFRLNQTHRIMN